MIDMNQKNKFPGSEAELIELFRALFEPIVRPTDLLLGIGDDAAVFEPGVDPETKFVITADMLVEDVHFIKGLHSHYDVGWRTAQANLSDIAAMGALPRWGVVTLAVPSGVTRDEIMDFALGLKDAMDDFGAYVIGGDLTKSTDKISVSMTVVGETTGEVLKRSGAELGDVIAVTGTLGDSGLGLELMRNPDYKLDEGIRGVLINRHRRPHARVHHGQLFANNDGIHAMMDISDGLGIDLGRICAASVVGARIFEHDLPISKEVSEVSEALGRDPLEFVMSGEDFELLVTGTRAAVEYLSKYMEEEGTGPGLTVVGEIIDQPFGINLARVDGSVVNPKDMGWDHFRK